MISKILIIGGWGQRAADLAGLESVVSEFCAVQSVGPSELLGGDVPENERFSSGKPSSYAASLSALLAPTDVTLVVGISMGGLIAIEAALHFRERVERIALINSTACFLNRKDLQGEYAAGIPRSRLRAMMLGMRGAPRLTLNQFFQRAGLSGEAAERRTNRTLELDPSTLRHGLDYLEQIDFRDRLSEVRQQALLVHGGSDRIIPPEASRWASGKLSLAKLRVIEGESHELPQADPALCGEEIRRFVRE